MKKILLAGVLGGLTMFFWGYVSHSLLPLGHVGMDALPAPPADQALLDSIKATVTEPGLYMMPGVDESRIEDPEVMKAYHERASREPYGLLLLHRSGRFPGMGVTLVTEVITDIVVALVAAWLLCCASRSCRGYAGRVAFVTALGLVASFRPVQNWNWWGFPCAHTCAVVAEAVIGFLLVGLVIAALVKPDPEGAKGAA